MTKQMGKVNMLSPEKLMSPFTKRAFLIKMGLEINY